jgi:hypothetical protein
MSALTLPPASDRICGASWHLKCGLPCLALRRQHLEVVMKLLPGCVFALAVVTGCADGGSGPPAAVTTSVQSEQAAPETAAEETPGTADEAEGETLRAPTQLTQCLPEPGTEADLVVPDAPPRVLALNRRLAEAVAEHPAEVEALLAEHPGEPLPYREWMGLTREEYDELFALTTQAHEWGQVTVSTEKVGVQLQGSMAIFRAAGDLAALDGVTINLDTLSVETPAGTLEDGEPFQSEGAAGKLDGFRWSREDDAVSFDIAVIEGEDACFLQYSSGQRTPTGMSLAIRYAAADR